MQRVVVERRAGREQRIERRPAPRREPAERGFERAGLIESAREPVQRAFRARAQAEQPARREALGDPPPAPSDPFAQTVEHVAGHGPLGLGQPREALGEQPAADLELARRARGAAQPAREPAGAPAGLRAQRIAPHVERGLEPARGDAQVVHGLGVVERVAAARGPVEALEPLVEERADAPRQLGGVRGLVQRDDAHERASGSSAGRPSASSLVTRSHSSAEMSSTSRIASIVWKPNSRDSPSSSAITRRW